MTEVDGRGEIRRFERMGYATWPAFQVLPLEGWELRFADGFTGRSNSVQVLEAAPATPRQLASRIARCEAHYREQGLLARFKLTDAAEPAGLDATLAAAGYSRRSPTRVQAIDLPSDASRPSARVRVVAQREPAWLDAVPRLNGVASPDAERWRGIVERIPQPLCASIGVGSETEAVGLGALHAHWLFLGSVATAQWARGRGCARELVGALLAEAQARGARGAWLQVTEGNPGGLALYQKLGFRDVYGYWYREQSRAERA